MQIIADVTARAAHENCRDVLVRNFQQASCKHKKPIDFMLLSRYTFEILQINSENEDWQMTVDELLYFRGAGVKIAPYPNNKVLLLL